MKIFSPGGCTKYLFPTPAHTTICGAIKSVQIKHYNTNLLITEPFPASFGYSMVLHCKCGGNILPSSQKNHLWRCFISGDFSLKSVGTFHQISYKPSQDL